MATTSSPQPPLSTAMTAASVTSSSSYYCNQKRLAYFNYKFITADHSQVCDGRLLKPFSSVRGVRRGGCSDQQSSRMDDERNGQSSTSSGLALEVLENLNFLYRPKRNASRVGDDKRQEVQDKRKQEVAVVETKPSCDDEVTRTQATESDSSSARRPRRQPQATKRLSCPPPHTVSSSGRSNGNINAKAMLRTKHQPCHRLNHSITGIMRVHPRYSIGENDAGPTRRATLPASLRRSSLPNNKPSFETCSYALEDVSNRSSDSSWIPIGVDFCAHMEVYVFEKNKYDDE